MYPMRHPLRHKDGNFNLYLSPGGRFCSFSPCIEQVQRTCLALQEHAFTDISTMEVLQSEIGVARRKVPVRDLSFLKHKVKIRV